MGLILIGMIF